MIYFVRDLMSEHTPCQFIYDRLGRGFNELLYSMPVYV